MMTSEKLAHIPILRWGQEYESINTDCLKALGTDEPLANISQANSGLIRRDIIKQTPPHRTLEHFSSQKIIEFCNKAADMYLYDDLPLGANGVLQSRNDYIKQLSSTTGLPYTLCRANMLKVAHVMSHADLILKGLTRSIDPEIFDTTLSSVAGSKIHYYTPVSSLGVVLPSNSPAVNSLWLPSIAMKVPVVLKPGREDPWTPFRIIQALIKAGVPREMFSFYPTDHGGADDILNNCQRAIAFGGDDTVKRYAHNPNIQVHGTGFSKIIIGEDQIDTMDQYIDLLADSIAANGGRSCINTSTIIVPSRSKELADALAKRLLTRNPRPRTDEEACLAGFANPAMADWINQEIDNGLESSGAEDVSLKLRASPRKTTVDNMHYLMPTVVHCDSIEHPLAIREFLFPYCSIIEMPQDEMLDKIGYTLVLSAFTENKAWIDEVLRSPNIDRVNIGQLATNHIEWDQPHEGNLFELLYERRAIQMAASQDESTHNSSQAILTPGETPNDFTIKPSPKIVYGSGCISQIGELAQSLEGKNALIVTDTGIVKAGHVSRVKSLLSAAGFEVNVFDQVTENPSMMTVNRCVSAARAANVQILIGLGGGSSMDTAKACNFIFTNGGTMSDYQGYGKASKPMLPLIAIPTTGGTGSECQSYALISDERTHVKFACGDPKALPAISILDPELTMTQPEFITACTAVDALAHALESAVSLRKNPYSSIYSEKAFQLIAESINKVLEDPNNKQARSNMLLGASFAGIAIENSMLGSAHATANPLTASLKMVHGRAVALTLPAVIRFNSEDPESRAIYLKLCNGVGLTHASDAEDKCIDTLIKFVRDFTVSAGFTPNSTEKQNIEANIDSLSKAAAEQWTGKFNPRECTIEDFKDFYRSLSNS